jgi:NAD(P)H dehydrogenase (quinone)
MGPKTIEVNEPNPHTFFVTGSTGELGRIVIDELLKRVPASNIVAGVRSLEHDVAKRFHAKGIELRLADYTQPATLTSAFEGVDRLLLISSNALEDRRAQHEQVIDAARRAGVSLLAYTSLLHADTSPLGLGDIHRRTEVYLKRSGVPFVLLRNGWYTENHAASVPHALQSAQLMGSAATGRFSSVSRNDLAEAAAVVLTSDDQEGRVYELAGDESYSLEELAAMISTVSGKKVTYKDMSQDDFERALVDMRLPKPLAQLIADADVGASLGGLQDDSRQLSALLGRRLTDWRKAIRDAVTDAAKVTN